MTAEKRDSHDQAPTLVPVRGGRAALGSPALFPRPVTLALAPIARRQSESAPRDGDASCFPAGFEYDLLAAAAWTDMLVRTSTRLSSLRPAPGRPSASQATPVDDEDRYWNIGAALQG